MNSEAATAPWPGTRFSIGPRPQRREMLLVGAVLLAYFAMVLLLVIKGGPLGHDESVYSLRAESFRLGQPEPNVWAAYRAPGLPFVLQAAWIAGPSEISLRLVTVGFGLLLVAGTWLLGRAQFGPRAGLIAAAGVAVTPFIVSSSIQVWPDVPGAALGIMAIGILAFSTAGNRVSWWVVLVAPLVAAATVVRFGAPLQLAAGLGVVGIWRWPVIRRSLLPAAIGAIGSSAAVAAILLVPAMTASSAAPLTATMDRATRWFEGFGDYALEAGALVGSVSGVLVGIGVLTAIVTVAGDRAMVGPVAAMVGAGLATFVVTATMLHGELRYLSPTYPLLWVAAGFGLAALTESIHLPRPIAVAGVVGLSIALVVAALDGGQATNRFNTQNYRHIEDAADWADGFAAGESCAIQTGHTPQVGWYSDCTVVGYPSQSEITTYRWLGDHHDVVFLFRVQNGKRQPGPAIWDGYPTPPVASIDDGEVLIYQIDS